MNISGFVKNSLIDYPGKIASVVFTQGCNMFCKYCHNYDLIPTNGSKGYFNEDEILNYLKKARSFIDALVISGGEPTLQNDLLVFISKVKELGLLVKLDTNGSNPAVLQKLIDNDLLDCVSMDIKTKLEVKNYRNLVGGQFSDEQMNSILESISLLKKSEIDVEFRTTMIREVHTSEDIRMICTDIASDKKYTLQRFSPVKVFDNNYSLFSTFTENELTDMINRNAAIMPNMCYL